MLSKPINLLLVYIVTTFNISILLSPILALSIPFIRFQDRTAFINLSTIETIKIAIFSLIFLVSFIMLLYFVLDFIFGFSVRFSLKKCTPYEKFKNYDFLTEILDQVKNKFGERGVKLYIKNTREINAYAVSSFGSKAIILTRGLIEHYLVEFADPKEFLYALRSIIGHEMSHLTNKDFLPTFLIITNQKATNLISKIIHFFFGIISRVLVFIPYGGRASTYLMNEVYTLLNVIINFFNQTIIYNLYQFLRKFASRSIEYRCDRQSAQAFGGKNMALALSKLGDNGYFSLFSTHPRTKARIRKVKDVKISGRIIRPSIIDSLSNYFALMLLVFISLYFAKEAGIDLLVRQFIENHAVLHRKLLTLWNLIQKIY